VTTLAAPLLELGLGLGSLFLPDYHGSNEYRPYVFPLPYVVYRGDAFRMDDAGAYGQVFASENVKLDVSAGAGLPVSGKKNQARNEYDLPALETTAELGPLLTWRIAAAGDHLWTANFAVREVFGLTTKGIVDRGTVVVPYLKYERTSLAQWNRYDALWIVLGPTFGSKRYHEFFYSVPDAYEVKRGYGGTRVTMTYKRRYDSWWVGAFAQYETMRGAVFRDSPLVRTQDYTAVGLATTWVLSG